MSWPIEKSPFYAVAVVPTPLGTSLGVRTDIHSQALDGSDRPIPGLYVCGNDQHSIVAGEYPGAGSQLGLGMTFAYLAVMHACRAERVVNTAAVGGGTPFIGAGRGT
ncbi:MAG: FAD-binding protein [Candidatus Korobacteraceae bacterium]